MHHHHDDPGMDPPARESLYQLAMQLQDDRGRAIDLGAFRGRPLLVTMFYGHCTSVCPMITAQLKDIVGQLCEAQRQRLDVLMVSFDSVRDTPEALAAFRADHHLEAGTWTLARARADDVRALAAVLGIRYRELPGHDFNHTALVTLADRGGILRARTTMLSGTDEPFAKFLRDEVGGCD